MRGSIRLVRVAAFVALLAGGAPLIVGCGQNRADAFRARAIQRPPEDEEESPPKPAPAPVATAAAPPAESPDPTGAAAKESTPTAAAQRASTARELPATPEGRVQRTVENLERIAAALEAYREAKRAYPPVAIKDVSRAPLLSWRVEILPFLGYEDLYKRFDKTQPWYAPVNKPLLAHIPPEYQSPERGGEKTNYLAPLGTSTIFQQLKTLHVSRVEDGLTNTALVIEADDRLAVEWTRPQEYAFDPQSPTNGFGGLRSGNLLLIWGGGMVGSIPMSSPTQAFKGVFTADGGERFTSAGLNVPVDVALIAGAQPTEVAASTSPADPAQAMAPGSARRRGPAPASVAASELAQKFNQAAVAALAAGDVSSGWLWWNGAAALGAAPPDAYQWYPALRRPAAAVHFAVGVATNAAPARARRPVRPGLPSASRIDLNSLSEPCGEILFSAVERHAMKVSLPRLLADGNEQSTRRSRRDFDPAAAITVLPPGSPGALRDQADEAGCDVLVMLEVSENKQRTRKTLRLKVYDLAGRKELLTSRRLTFTAARGGDDDSGEDLDQVKWDLQDLLEDGLSPKPWPVNLTARIAGRRVDSLAGASDPFPPRVLAEVCYYRNKGLIDNADALAVFEGLLGEGGGVSLMLGSDTKKRRALREWLPSMGADEQIAMADRRRRERDDD